MNLYLLITQLSGGKKAPQLNLNLTYLAYMRVYYGRCKFIFFYILKYYIFIGI